MRLSKIKVALALLGLLVAFVLLVRYGLLYRAYLQVQALPAVEDPVAFSKEFNPHAKEPVNLKVGGLEGRTILSPFFPHRKLKTTAINQERCNFVSQEKGKSIILREDRALNLDPFWNVFWVEIAECGEHTKFFGPYRATR